MDVAQRSNSRRNSAGLARDLELLEALGSTEAGQSGGLGVVRIAQLTGRDKGVVSRALATLADAELVERNEDMTYRLGAGLYALAARTAHATLIGQARPYLRSVAQRTRETTHLCVLSGGNVLTVMSELSPHEFGTTGWAGVTTAAWRTPSGRVLLSDWDDDSLAFWYAEHGKDAAIVGQSEPTIAAAGFSILDSPDEDKIVVRDLDSLRAELARIRQRGYATLDEELERGVVGASAPVRDFAGRVVAALNVSAPKSRISDRLDSLGGYVARAAERLSGHIGGHIGGHVSGAAFRA